MIEYKKHYLIRFQQILINCHIKIIKLVIKIKIQQYPNILRRQNYLKISKTKLNLLYNLLAI